jgi:hypothetical protein
VKEVYIVATEDTEPLGPEAIGEAFETDEVTVELEEVPGSFRLRSAEAEIAVRFEALESPLGWTPELLTGSESAHARLRQARGLYRVAFETPTGSQPTVGCSRPCGACERCSRSGRASCSTRAPSSSTRRRTSGRSPSWISTSATT